MAPERRVARVAGLPPGYPALLNELKRRIRAVQLKAAVSVNRELIGLYWDIGKTIVERQRSEGWGKSVVDCLAGDLQREFPGMEGFSPSNIWRMRSFYLAWTREVLAQPAREAISLPARVTISSYSCSLAMGLGSVLARSRPYLFSSNVTTLMTAIDLGRARHG